MTNQKNIQTPLTVGELITILQKYPSDMIAVINDNGPGHDYTIVESDVKISKYPYFGNDKNMDFLDKLYSEDDEDYTVKFLQIGVI